MKKSEQQEILNAIKTWFREVILPNHIKNTEKLANADEFDINPFLTPYLAAFLTGELTNESVAKALLYPRVLGTSITTSFGQNMQQFISAVLKDSYGSLVPGIDLEFIDAVDGRKKYCQAKLGPNTINKDDVETIHHHFRSAKNLGRTNKVEVQQGDLVVGILYGELGQESNHYKKLRDQYDHPLYIGQEFWLRLTGEADFYRKLQNAIAEVAVEARGAEMLDRVTKTLSETDAIRKIVGEK